MSGRMKDKREEGIKSKLMSNNKVVTEQINVIFQCSKIFKTKDCNLPPFLCSNLNYKILY